MSKVLIAEGLGYNLLSVSQLMAKGIHLEADSTTQEFKLYHGRGGLYIGKAVLKNNIFVLDFVPDLGTADSDGIVNFTNWTHPPDLDPDFSPEGFCAPAYAPLEKVYSDILYNRERGQGAYSYTITFIDAATRYVWHLNLPSEDMAFEAFIAWLPVAERESGEKLKSFQSDEGGEYTSQRFKQFLVEKGIKRLISLPYAHQQQGVAERMNRTLQNTMRKLLRGMRLPNHQWPGAMDHAVMLHNLLSSSSLPNNASPHLLWTGKHGSTKMLRVFGCMVQYRPPSARAGRFSQRAQWGLHLGIEKNYNAWKIFDIHSKETVAARDVIFYERLTLLTYLANLEENRDPTGGFRGDRHFASAADEADWDEQNVDNASDEAGPLPYCSVPIPMDNENPRESVNAETYFDLADTGYVTPAEVNTNEAERVGPNFIPDPEDGDEATYPEDTTLPRYTQSGLQILGLVTAVVPIGVARNKTVLTGKWVFRVKTKADGTIDKFKARWVVRGFDQEHGRDFTETFAPVSRHTSLRILLAVAAMKRKKLRQIDVANAFLYAPVDAEIYVKLPHGSHGEPNQVCQLQKSLYRIKQAPRLWQQYLHARLTRIGFKQLPHDQGMYRLTKNDDYILLIVYVDDLLYIGSNDGITTWFEGELQRDLTLTVSSTVTQYLGLNIREEKDVIYLSAEKYADTIAKRFTLTPSAITTPYRYTAGNDKGGLLKPAGIRDYQKKLGCLLFAVVTCRPDLSYSASQLATYLKKPEAEHLAELDRALHYFASTPTIGLTYYKNATTPTKLIGYVDADHAGDSDNRRSRTGYIYRLEPIGPISWQSSKQELIALSSAEAEYIALCSATKEGLYLRELLEEAKLAQLPSFSLFCDNQSAILIANKNGFANRTKHIALRYFFVKDEIEKGRLELSYCSTSEMAADYLTKKLGKSKFEYCMLLTGQSHVIYSDTPEAKGTTALAAAAATALAAAATALAAAATAPAAAAPAPSTAATALLLQLQPLLLLLQPLLLPLQPLLLPLQPLLLQLQPCCCCYLLQLSLLAAANLLLLLSTATAAATPLVAPAVRLLLRAAAAATCYSCCSLLLLLLAAAVAPCCCCSLLPLLLATAAAGGGAARSAGSVAGAGGAGGATGSAGGAGPTTDRRCLSWPLSRQLQQLGVDSGGHCLSLSNICIA
ncbi:unnamed protein product, partial [Closterium sp. NIES-53]